MNEIKVFSNFEFGTVRTTEIENKTFFVANDVAKALGYTNPSKATNDHCKNSTTLWGNDSLGRPAEFKIIPESDVYRLIVSSKLPNAEKFEHWVFEEVLPSIRKNGMWATDELLNNPDFLVEVALKLKEEKALRLAAEEKNALLMASNETYTPTQIAKELGFPVRGFCGFLHAEGYIYYQNNSWEPYSQYSDWFITKTDIVNGFTKYWIHITQKGRANLLKKYGGLNNA